MPRMKILNSVEREVFDFPPIFNSVERKRCFDFPTPLQDIATSLRTAGNQLVFLLSCGYFKATKRFYPIPTFHRRDLTYVADRIAVALEGIDLTDYPKQTMARHQAAILNFYGFRAFKPHGRAVLSAKNRFYRANRDLGRIFKTEFILQYLSEPELRRRIRRGLLKVEQLHALARDVFYGRRGRINARELWEQMNTCSCLNLILACIVYWQACEISRVLSECDPLANGIDLSLLEHVSPIEWDNVVLYGQYILDRKLVRRHRRAKRVFLSV